MLKYLFAVKITLCGMIAIGLALLVTTDAFAIAAPVPGTFAYDVYDIAILKMLQGPIGFVAGVMAIVVGAVLAIRSEIMPAIPAVIGGAILLKADAIVQTLGAVF